MDFIFDQIGLSSVYHPYLVTIAPTQPRKPNTMMTPMTKCSFRAGTASSAILLPSIFTLVDGDAHKYASIDPGQQVEEEKQILQALFID
jgi:hypothetical protein